MANRTWVLRGAVWVVAAVVVTLAPAVGAQGVAMVLSATAPAEVIDSREGIRPARPMLVLEEGETVVTGEGGSVLVVLFADSLEYTIGTNGRTRVVAAGLEKESGSLEVSSNQERLELPSNSTLSSRRLMGEMIRDHRTEESNFVHPPNFAQVRSGSLLFRWQLTEPAETVAFALYDPNDEEILSAEVMGDSLSFPPEGYEELRPGAHYFTEVYDTSTPSGSVSGRAQAEFRVMTAAEVAEVEAGERRVVELGEHHPDDPAPLMELMILYLHHKLFADAVATGERLQIMLGDNPELLHVQARALLALGLTDRARDTEKRAIELEAAG